MSRDFEELLAEFNAGGVRYLIGGAHALAFHARPRASKDLDIYVDPTPANAKRTVRALRRFFRGDAPRYVDVEALLEPDTIIQLGVAPVRVDLLSHLATTGFATAWKRRAIGKFGREPASYLGLDDLIAEKAHYSRPQDRADLIVLRKVHARRSRSAAKAAPVRSRPRSTRNRPPR